MVAVSANKGLCGAFNANVIKRTVPQLNEYSHLPAENISILCVGRKAYPTLSKRNNSLLPLQDDTRGGQTHLCTRQRNRRRHHEAFPREASSTVWTWYTTSLRRPLRKTWWWSSSCPSAPTKSRKTKTANKREYIYQPNKEEIVLNLIPASLKTRFFKVILDSQAAEHGARMTAMHKATDNAGELLKELKLSYNKARQAAITNEILEIVASAEALN